MLYAVEMSKFQSKSIQKILICLQDFQELECANTKLTHEVKMLEAEKKRLEDILTQHLAVCPSAQGQPSPD